MPDSCPKNSLSFTGGQKYFSCLLKKTCPTAIQSICKGVGCSIKGKAWVTEGNFSSLVLSKDFIQRLPAFFSGRIFTGNLARFCLLVFYPNRILVSFFVYKKMGVSMYHIQCC